MSALTRRVLRALSFTSLVTLTGCARGCTSGQALTGGAVLSLGSWVFMMAVFTGGYIVAPLVRRQWR